MDRNGNRHTYTYNNGRISSIKDGLGQKLTFSYNGKNLIARVADQTGRGYTIKYNADGYPSTLKDPLGFITQFNYSPEYPSLITDVTYPEGNTPYRQAYRLDAINGELDLRVSYQTDAYHNTLNLLYDTGSNKVTEARPDGTSVVHEHSSIDGVIRSVADGTGKKALFDKTDRDQVSGVTDRLGHKTTLSYHPSTGMLQSTTDAEGGTRSHTYTSQEQVFTNPSNGETVSFTFYHITQTLFPDGTKEKYTHDKKGNRLSRKDQAGKVWSYTYDNRGLLLTATNPTGGVTTRTYNKNGTLASIKDSDIKATRYVYDALKRLTRIIHPDGTFIETAYTLKDQVASVTDERGLTSVYGYDANGRFTRITDPKGHSATWQYDLMDRPMSYTDLTGRVTALSYDSLSRPSKTVTPDGMATTFAYDKRGWLEQTTVDGKTWRTGYDDEGIVAERITPLGYKTTFSSDSLGYLAGATNPLGQTTSYSRDAMKRLTSVTDPTGRTKTLGYDPRGLLTSIGVPALGAVAYDRNDDGQLAKIRDLNGARWSFGYTTNGRLRSKTDPLGRRWTYSFDARGRVLHDVGPDRTKVSYSYDDAGTLTRIDYSDSTSKYYQYNELDQLTQTNGQGFTLDAEGRITTTKNEGRLCGATYDNGGRLQAITYDNEALTVSYTYNGRGLLSGVADNLTGSQLLFTYDDDNRLVGIKRSNGVNTAYKWDAANHLTRVKEGNIIDLQYTFDKAGRATSIQYSTHLDPASALVAGTVDLRYDKASQINSPGYAYDPQGRLTATGEHTFAWDGASRLVGIDGAVDLVYNGLDEIAGRAEGGGITHYLYNHAIDMSPIMAELDGRTRKAIRYYVWTPFGELLYMIDVQHGDQVLFYHFDTVGSTLALTDQGGNLTDAYAYSPYGMLLKHVGTSLQPFTFCGRWGVRKERAVRDLYHMRDRYYDATTARFISRDPLWPQILNPLSINPYNYALNDPVQFLDVNGQSFLNSLIQWLGKKAIDKAVDPKTQYRALSKEDNKRACKEEKLDGEQSSFDVLLYTFNYKERFEYSEEGGGGGSLTLGDVGVWTLDQMNQIPSTSMGKGELPNDTRLSRLYTKGQTFLSEQEKTLKDSLKGWTESRASKKAPNHRNSLPGFWFPALTGAGPLPRRGYIDQPRVSDSATLGNGSQKSQYPEGVT